MQLQPALDRSFLWGNLHKVILPVEARPARYMVIHDIIPLNVRLHTTRLMDTENYTQGGSQDTILH